MELENLLERLKLDHLQSQLDAICEQASQHQLNYKDFLVQALQTEWQGRFQRGSRPWTNLSAISNPVWIASRCGNWPG